MAFLSKKTRLVGRVFIMPCQKRETCGDFLLNKNGMKPVAMSFILSTKLVCSCFKPRDSLINGRKRAFGAFKVS